MSRYANRNRITALDPATAASEIYRITAYEEFPWDLTQALGLALFRTYAIPSIGELLHGTGEFTERTQKRYDDTVLLMDAAIEHGVETAKGRAAVRRMNQMHRSYDISNGDMLYVLCTFVVVPIRWIDTWGWRRTTPQEREASALMYARIGEHMGIHGIPDTYAAFSDFMDDYERDHFGYSTGGRAVSDATLALMTTFPPFHLLPARVTTRLSYSLMDEPLLDALRLPRPGRAERAFVGGVFRLRARIERLLPPRRRPKMARDLTTIRSYPRGHRDALPIEELGTFPRCPVDHESRDQAQVG